jgi:bacteriocin-like protein
MKKIEDSELNQVNGGADEPLTGAGPFHVEIDMNQDGGSGDEEEPDNTLGRTDGGQQHLG